MLTKMGGKLHLREFDNGNAFFIQENGASTQRDYGYKATRPSSQWLEVPTSTKDPETETQNYRYTCTQIVRSSTLD